MHRGHKTRWTRLANPVLASLRTPRKMDITLMDLQIAQAIDSLSTGQVSDFEAKVLESLSFVVSKLARAGIGPEALACSTRCQALMASIHAGQLLRVDQVQAFADLAKFAEAQREAAPAEYIAASRPFVN